MRSPLLTPFLLLAFAPPIDAAPLRIIAEGEDFRPASGEWKVVPYRENYFASTFAISFLSRMACLGIGENAEGLAVQEVTIPQAGEFHVLSRYEQPYNFAAEFTVEVSQGGKVVSRETFGKLADPKIWPFNGHVRVPMERFGWGGTDNIVWQQKGVAKLAAGPATIKLIAGPQTGRAAKRHVDVVCLTDDAAGMEAQKKTSYLELDGWLVQDGDVFVRFTNPADGLGACVPVVAPEVSGQHSPYYVHVRDWPTTWVLRTGRVTTPSAYQLAGPRSLAVKADQLAPPLDASKYLKPMFTAPEAEYLQPGQTSGWVPLGQVCDSLNDCKWKPGAVYANKSQGLDLEIEFAIPDGAGGLRPLRKVRVKSPELFEMPANLAANAELAKALKERYWLPEIRTQREAVKWLLAEVKKFPDRGPTPKRLPVYGIMGFGGRSLDDPAVKELALALGDNTWADVVGKKRELVAHWPDPTLPAIQKLEKEHKGGFADLSIVSYGDEIHLPALPLTDDEFAAWLKAKGVAFPGKVEFVKSDKSHPLYYYSQAAAKEKGGKYYAAGTAYYASKGVRTGANYSPHANYLITELDYIRPFKLKAMSLPWGEDYVWQIPEFSTQVTGFLTSGFRAGAKYDNLPIHMYVMPHSPGNTPRDFRLSFYTAIAHGAKSIDYFCASPLAVGYTENWIATHDLATWKAVHATTHEAGVFEDYVMDGTVRPAKVGLLLSSVDEVMTGVNNFSLAMHNNERKALYYALRHAQVPVDFLSEDDVIDGRAKDYAVIYVGQEWVHSKALAALKKWAEAGGTVVATVGGGFKNEFNQPNPEANAFYGVKSQKIKTDPQLVSKYLLKENQPFLSKQDLTVYEPMDTAKWGQVADVPVVVWKQSLETAGGSVAGNFGDGTPAVVVKEHGKGSAVLFGFLPGQAYLKAALPVRPADRGATDDAFAHYLPTKLNVELRKAIVDAFLPAGFVRPVECSEPLVESTCIDSPGKLAVPLMNYTGKPIAALTVRLNGLASVKGVRSVERGKLTATKDRDALVITLPLNVADMLLIDR